VLLQALAGDTGAFLVPAEARAAPPAWPAEFRGQYTGIKAIGAGLRIDVQRSYTRPGVYLGPARNVLIRVIILTTVTVRISGQEDEMTPGRYPEHLGPEEALGFPGWIRSRLS
jgi:hypothetical protein